MLLGLSATLSHTAVVWAVALVTTAAFLATAATSLVGGHASRQEANQVSSGPEGYYVDRLLRTSSPTTEPYTAALRTETQVIFANAMRTGEMPSADKTYLVGIVASRSGVNEPEAEKRVDDDFTQARQAVDAARKALAHSMYWAFLALLVGAFSASFAATIGGRQRDLVIVV